MGIDLYAGPLQRYYTRRWETPGAAAAREAGLHYELVHAGGVDPLSLHDVEAEAEVGAFAERLQARLQLGETPPWRESFEAPYKSVQLTPRGLSALVLWAAYLHRPELERPKVLPEDPESAPAVAEASDGGYYMGPMAVFEAHMVVPGAKNLVGIEVDPIGRELFVTTSAALNEAIAAVAPSLDLAAAVVDAGPPGRGPVLQATGRKWYEFYKPKWRQVASPPLDDEVKAFATYALAAFTVMRAFAAAQGVPILRDE